MADKIKSIDADTPEEFVDKAQAAIGLGDALGVTTFDVSKTKFTLKSGVVSKADLQVTTEITRAAWKGFTGNSEKGMKAVSAWVVQHENKHVALANDIVSKAKKAFERDVVGKTAKEAQDMLDDITADINKAYKALDAKEGIVTPVRASNGTYTLKESGV